MCKVAWGGGEGKRMKANVQVDDGLFCGWLVWIEADVKVAEVDEGRCADG